MRRNPGTVVVCRSAARPSHGAVAWLAAGLALLCMSGAASGQVAAPPLTPFSFVTDNPAAMQWGTPSRIGAAYSKGELVTDPVTVKDNSEGGSAGVRLVDRPAAGALEYSRIESTTRPFNQSEYNDTVRAALAIGLGKQISLGVGQTNEQIETGGVSGQLRDSLETPVYGVTLRPVEWLYLGGAGGKESVKHDNLNFPAANYRTTRDIYMYGLGIRAGSDSAAQTHIEYYVKDRGKYADASIAGGRETSRTAVAELAVASFLAGIAVTHTERDTGFPTSDETRVELGLVPTRGYALVVRRQETTDTFPAGAAILSRTASVYTIAIMYQFRGFGL
jgi:hypothetical protein